MPARLASTLAIVWLFFLPAATAAAPRPPRLIAVGDIASCASDGDEQTAALVSKLEGTIAVLGDIAYESGSAADFANCFLPSWRRLVPRIRAALGNHEYSTGTAAAAIDLFRLPKQGWYSYRLGSLARDRSELELRRDRRLRTAVAGVALAPGRPSNPRKPLHARVLAPPPLQFGRARLGCRLRGLLGSACSREGRRGPGGPRPRLRALRAAEGDSLVRRRHRRQEPLSGRAAPTRQPGAQR